MNKKNYITLVVIVLIIFIVSYIEVTKKMWKNESKVIFWDVKSYYAYLPAIIIHCDPLLNFIDENNEKYKDRIWPETSKNGNKVIITSMGLAVLYSPFFLLGHLYAYISGAEMDGYSPPYFFALLLSSLFYLSLGLFCLRKILLNYFSDFISAITIASIFLGTNLLWYSTHEATMSHAYSFSLISFFLYFTIKWHEKQDVKISILTGIIFGLLTLVRPTNGLVLVFFILYNIKTSKDIFLKFKFFLQNYKYLIVITLFAFVVLIPQLFYWKYVTGQWFYYSYGDKGNFFFNNPQIINGLFSYRKGWFIYTPIMLIAFLSIPLILKKDNLKQFFIPVITFVIINIYIILSWWSWWYGGGLGLRAFIDSYAIMAIPLAAFFDWTVKTKTFIKIMNFTIAAIFILYGTFTNIQYYYGAIHWDSMTKEAFWDSFLSPKHGSNFNNLLKTPDYEKAKNGIQAVIEPTIENYSNVDFSFSEEIFCDAEFIDDDKKMFTTENGNYFFDGVSALSSDYVFSGKNSIKLSNENQFGFTTLIGKVNKNDKFLISVKRLTETYCGYLVIQTDDAAVFYKSVNQANVIENSDWKEIQVLLEIPENINGLGIKIYCYNPENEDVYFDDLLISKIETQN